jgi:hypothetical protein
VDEVSELFLGDPGRHLRRQPDPDEVAPDGSADVDEDLARCEVAEYPRERLSTR